MNEPRAGSVRPLQRLLDVLDVERLDRDLYRGYNVETDSGRLFGGQIAAQALRAAQFTVVEQHSVHSLHSYFLRPGREHVPVILHVDRIRDGRSFTTRRVVAVQEGEAIFTLAASFQRDEPGSEYQRPPAEVPEPDDMGEHWRRAPTPDYPPSAAFVIHELTVPPADKRGLLTATRRYWARTDGPLPDDPTLHAAVLAYLSDLGTIFGAASAIGLSWDESIMAASLDHAMWFHRPIRADEWMLVELAPLSNSGARGLVVASVHSQAGVLAASMTQEALVREQREGTT